jgi:hypothetical protein
VADRAVVIPVPFLAWLEAYLFLILEPLFGLSISVALIISLTLLLLGLLLGLHRLIVSCRMTVYRGSGLTFGIVYCSTGLVTPAAALLLGPQWVSGSAGSSLGWIPTIALTSVWFVAGALAFQLESIMSTEAYGAQESKTSTDQDSDRSLDA